MEISDELLCVFTASLEEAHDSLVVEIPEQEVSIGDVQRDGTYCVALLSTATAADEDRDRIGASERSGPPVEPGDQHTVDIEDIGEQGDGIARVERGYVIIVPDTERGDRVAIEITNVRENLAFGDVIDRGPDAR